MKSNMGKNDDTENPSLSSLKDRARTIRTDILAMIYAAQSGHPGGSLSAADIVTALYFSLLKIEPQNPYWADRDRFILSKGHACPVWYACLAERGFFPVDELLTLREINGRLQGHPDMKKTPGVDFTTGSLGQGLSAGVGMALGLKAEKRECRVYVMLGDGELNEGQVWEAAMAAAKFWLDNLTVFIDYNNLQLDGRCDEVMPIEPLKEKWESFNWNVTEIDGHDMQAIIKAIEDAQKVKGKPSVIIAHTIKGKGVSFMEDECHWHGKVPNKEEFLQAIREVNPGGKPPPLVEKALAVQHDREDAFRRESLAPIKETLSHSRDAKPTRDAFGEILVELGEEYPEVVVFEADISTSTRTCLFAEQYPERFFQFGVAEANMMAAAAGMATLGKVPFVSTYAVFASMRACEQVRTLIAYPNLKVKIAVSHGGITPANDGVTHQGSEDIGIMRTIPNMTVIMPADYNATKQLVREALHHPGPVYLRFTRDAVPFVYEEDEQFEIGKGKILIEGKDFSLIAIGDMISVALEAAELLKRKGIQAEVIDMHTLKPIDSELIIASVMKTKKAITIEDHQIHNGLGSAVAEVLGEKAPHPIRRIGLRDTFAESGRYDLLLKKYGMDAIAVVRAAEELMIK